MYHTFFGLNEQAFSIAVNPRYLYMSDQHREALAHLVYGIQVGGFVLLTGEVGTGKTTIIRCLLEQLPEDTDIAIVLNPMASAPELLSIICDELGVRYVADHVTIKDLVDALHEYLLHSHMKGRKTVLLIDEAQLLKPGVLEQIRLLTNLETTTEKLLQIILVGQPELKRLLERPSLRQLSQRITARFHLEALSLAETQAYIAHRLAIAGMSPHQNPFPAAIVKKIHEFSGGVPRLINVLCERMLLGAYGKNQQLVDHEVFRQAAIEVSGQQPETFWSRIVFPRWHLGLIAGLLVLLVGSFVLGRASHRADQISAGVHSQQAQIVAVPAASVAVEELPVVPSVAVETIAEPVSADAHGEQMAVTDAVVDIAPPPPSSPKFWTRNYDAAQQSLASYLGVVDPAICEQGKTFACEKTQVSTWDDLKDINRPAVLTLITADKKQAYVTLVGLSEDRALVIQDKQFVIIDWAELAALWNGSVAYLWQRPPGFDRPLVLGDKGRAVTWLAQQFAVLDKQAAPLSRDTFSAVMKKRVEIFQTSQGLEPDGIVGAQTLRRLNEVLGVDKALITDEARFTELSAVGIE